MVLTCDAEEYDLGPCDSEVTRVIAGNPESKTAVDIAFVRGQVVAEAACRGWLALAGGAEQLCPTHKKEHMERRRS